MPGLNVASTDPLIDEQVAFHASGLDPGQRATLTLVEETDGERFRAEATFEADGSGVVDPAEHEPVAGYDGVRPMGLFQFAEPVGDADDDVPEGVRTATLSLSVDGADVDTVSFTRYEATPGVEHVDVTEDGFVGDLLVPPGDGPHPGILLFGGSGGGRPVGPRARVLASRGYAVFALAYFGCPGLPDALAEIPLSYFYRGIEWFTDRPDVRNEPLGAVGGSRGGELALLLATRVPALTTVVATVPSGVVWPSPSEGDVSSWTEDGEPVEYVPVSFGWATIREFADAFVRRRPVSVRHAFEVLDDTDDETLEAATIPVETIGGPVLLVSGGDDQVWPADLARVAADRLAEHDYPHPHQHRHYPDAGHGISIPYTPTTDRAASDEPFFFGLHLALGGTPEAYARADEDSWQYALEYLERGLRTDGSNTRSGDRR